MLLAEADRSELRVFSMRFWGSKRFSIQSQELNGKRREGWAYLKRMLMLGAFRERGCRPEE
jgi:hypothetical protein